MTHRFLLTGLIVAGFLIAAPAPAQNPVLKAQADRVALIEKMKPPVVAIFVGGGAGTGIIISDDGYALTNFHVVAGGVKNSFAPTMKCGLPDGFFYDAVTVGLDRVGDVALIKLLPRVPGQKFPTAVIGDSDLTREGEWTVAMGNPVRLATDFQPTVTYGMVSGVHRYQYPAGVIIEYTDCIQIDTSINPGNSGGPLFNMKGELIGINGRGSVVQDKGRGVMNSGVGYAISLNQIKNFLGHLRAGLDADHASLGAVVSSEVDATALGKVRVSDILEDSDVARRGLDTEDELVSFAGRPITTVNQFKNVLGLFPRGWRVPLEYRHEGSKKEILARLMGVQRKTIADQPDKVKLPDPTKQPIKGPPAASGPGAKFFEAKPGYANYYFNRLERDRLLADFKKHGDFSKVAGNWSIEGNAQLIKSRTEDKYKLDIQEVKDGNGLKPVVKFKIIATDYEIEPLKSNPATLKLPNPSGGMLAALYVWHRFLTMGEKGFTTECSHGGYEPFYPPLPDNKQPPSLASLRVDTEVINTRYATYLTKWFFSRADQKLLGFELRMGDGTDDPCEVYFSDYRAVQGRMLPHRIQVYYQGRHYGTFTVSSYTQGAGN